MTSIILLVFWIYKIMIFIRVIASWVQFDPDHPIMNWLIRWTEPVLEPLRRILGGDRIGIDFSPFIVLLILQLLEQGILRVAG
jgi:YggT family protein